MSRIEISGIGIAYELLGKAGAPAVALTPGGRLSKDTPGLRELAEKLVAGGKRVLLWDRPNCGASDICFDGENESALHGRILTQLIRALDLGPTAIGGGSAGSRTTLLAAVHDPEIVSHLLQWWISGGAISLLLLGATYFGEAAITASMGGMAAVADLPMWAEQIKRNPRNRDIILKQDPDRFMATMERWAVAFIPSDTSPVPGMSPADFARLTMPVLIYRGSPRDLYHPVRISDWVHKLIPHAKLIDLPWTDDATVERVAAAVKAGTASYLHWPAFGFVDWPRLAPTILEFTGR
ncbi:MAG: alpha/beta hydrolase [Rhodospirillaceae bacterium]|nr:MAG: alpha/beta hydrolase [Rhodospirillaceae bacterium]